MDFNKGTRDDKEVIVKIDISSGVIFIDDFYVGDNTYEEGNYRNDEKILNLVGGENYEALTEGICSGEWLTNITLYDQLRVPASLAPGEWVLGFRWDCESSAQVWQSCADITITN